MKIVFRILLVILLVIGLLWTVVSIAGWKFKRHYVDDVNNGVKRTRSSQPAIITQDDMAHLPELVRDYLLSAGVVGKPQVVSMKAKFEAQMRGRAQDWFTLKAEQHNFFDTNERLFYMDARFKGLPTKGYHCYKDGQASMKIMLLGLLPVVDISGDMMFKAETVTFFNDMCFLAPATLINKQIQWQEIDSSSVKATFKHRSSTISAVLYFNEAGQLVNFISDDRYDVNDKKQYRFSTPLSEYGTINGFNLPTYGEAIWHYPEGEFVYGKYKLKSIEYNVQK